MDVVEESIEGENHGEEARKQPCLFQGTWLPQKSKKLITAWRKTDTFQ